MVHASQPSGQEPGYAVATSDGGIYQIHGAWDDLRVPLTSTKLGGSKDPSFSKWQDNGAGSLGVFAYEFSKTIEQEVYGIAQLPHTYMDGTDIFPHLHWGTLSTNASGTVIFGLEYTIVGKDEATPNTTVIEETITFTENIAGQERINGWTGGIDAATWNLTISDLILFRMYRKAASDTFDATVHVFEIDFHFQKDSNGSDNLFNKSWS